MPTCDRQTDGHKTTAYIVLALHRASKIQKPELWLVKKLLKTVTDFDYTRETSTRWQLADDEDVLTVTFSSTLMIVYVLSHHVCGHWWGQSLEVEVIGQSSQSYEEEILLKWCWVKPFYVLLLLVVIIRLHYICMHCIDAACCYRCQHSIVCLSVLHGCALKKKRQNRLGWRLRGPTQMRQKESCIRWRSRFPTGKGNFRSYLAPWKTLRASAAVYATKEIIEFSTRCMAKPSVSPPSIMLF